MAEMIIKLAIIVSIIISIECKESYIIEGSGWNNDLKKCASGGDDSKTYPFHIDTLDATGFKYEDINQYTYVRAHGDLELYTKKSGSKKRENMPLTEYVERNGYKQFSRTAKLETSSGWATQSTAIGLTVKIHQKGLIDLEIYVYAGSWGAVSCAWAKAYVKTIEIVN